MSKNILILTAVVSFFAGSALAKTPEPTNTAPLGAEVEKFPFFNQGELTVSYAEPFLGLRAEKLKKPLLVYNHFLRDGSWRLQTLPTGDEVWVEKSTGIPRYRAACSNRIVPVVPYVKCGEIVTSTFNPLEGNSNTSSLDRFLKGIGTGWDKATEVLGTMLGWLLPLLLLLALLALAAYGLYRLFQQIQSDVPPPAPPVVATTPTHMTPSLTILPTGEFVRSRPVTAAQVTPEGVDEKKSQPSSVPSTEGPEKPKVSEKPEVATGEFKIMKGGKGKPTAYVISGCMVGFEKRSDGSYIIREAE